MITANKLINVEVPVLGSQDDPVNALNLMDQFRVGHLAVVNNGKYLGLISETELLSVDTIISESIDHADHLITVSVLPQEHLLDILRTASEYHLSLVPVVNENHEYQGSITLEDLMNSLSQYQSASNPGAIVVLEMKDTDYSLQQIARIVEENDAKILSTNITSNEDHSLIEVNLKINKEDVNAILQSFDRFGYAIKASYQEPEYTEDLKKRYEELMRYLNT
jgi:CBS domain-containing protein